MSALRIGCRSRWPQLIRAGRAARGWLALLVLWGFGSLLAQASPPPLTAALAREEPIRLALVEGLSGPFANAGEAVWRNLLWAAERVNARGGVRLGADRARPLVIVRLDSKGSPEEALAMLRSVIDQRVSFIAQGNSSAVAAALVDALDKHNLREPERRVLLLNYAAVDPVLTNQRCSPWHFRFDAHADMRLGALVSVLQEDRSVQRVYLIGQDYSFGQQVSRQARVLIEARRPDIRIVGDELHPLGRIKDFAPYAAKIKASGAQAVLTGNWGNDLTLLVRALREVGSEARLYTFYGNALGVPAAIGDAGVDRVLAVSEWHPNDEQPGSASWVAAFRQRFPDPRDDYLHLRMQVMVDLLVSAIERAGSTDAVAVARALRGARFEALRLPPGAATGSAAAPGGTVMHPSVMRAGDHQLQQPLVVSVMARVGSPGVAFDVEGSGFGFRTLRRFDADALTQDHQCRMAALP